MDYENKYKNALEKAKSMIDNLRKGEDILAVSDLESMFPELAGPEDESIRKSIIDIIKSQKEQQCHIDGAIYDKMIAWLEKQGKQEQLYIRFGEIPTNEKSKIYQGEIEVGTENGVSVYPAFKTSEGDIVLGLSLPITKTTLYTQQHLIEYDNRPCYLVKGDYVGKDTDGQYLINNVSIIEKIDCYRAKEEKQDEQKPSESKFNVGDWIACEELNTAKIISINIDRYEVEFIDGTKGFPHIDYIDRFFHLWTIQDAKDGDVLCAKYGNDEMPFIFTGKQGDVAYCALNSFGEFVLSIAEWLLKISVLPATKEQRDILFAKMHEAGYMWDSKSKQLLSLKAEPSSEQKPTEWSEWDELQYNVAYNLCENSGHTITSDWLKSIKQRIGSKV